MTRIAVVGSVALDTVVRAARLAGPDDAASALLIQDAAGGSAANVAIALSRLGLRPTLVGSVGPGFRKSAAGRRLRSQGVDLSGLRERRAPTARALLVTDPRGRQSIYYFAGAASDAAPLSPPRSELAHFAAGPIDGYPRLMKGSGRVTFDPGQETLHSSARAIARCLPRTEILFANEFELLRLCKSLRTSPRRLVGRTLAAIVETRGARGQVLYVERGRVTVPAVPARVVDPTGAGDAHRAGFLLGLVKDLPLASCCKLGSVAASFAVEAVGAQGNLPTLRRLRARFRESFGAPPF